MSRSLGGMALSNLMSLSWYVIIYPYVTFLHVIVDVYEKEMKINECSISMWIHEDKAKRILIHFYCPQMCAFYKKMELESTHPMQFQLACFNYRVELFGRRIANGLFGRPFKNHSYLTFTLSFLASCWWNLV